MHTRSAVCVANRKSQRGTISFIVDKARVLGVSESGVERGSGAWRGLVGRGKRQEGIFGEAFAPLGAGKPCGRTLEVLTSGTDNK